MLRSLMWTLFFCSTITAGWFAPSAITWLQSPVLQPSDVRVSFAGGHGSGVHIGNGYIVTAAHVVAKKNVEYMVVSHDGMERKAEVLWLNSDYDVALLRVFAGDLKSSYMTCSPPLRGAAVSAFGNPYDIAFIETHGFVAGAVTKIHLWREAFVADLTLGPGMSGGPVFDEYGSVVGINVGVRLQRVGMAGASTGFAVIVPSSAICKLLARS